MCSVLDRTGAIQELYEDNLGSSQLSIQYSLYEAWRGPPINAGRGNAVLRPIHTWLLWTWSMHSQAVWWGSSGISADNPLRTFAQCAHLTSLVASWSQCQHSVILLKRSNQWELELAVKALGLVVVLQLSHQRCQSNWTYVRTYVHEELLKVQYSMLCMHVALCHRNGTWVL